MKEQWTVKSKLKFFNLAKEANAVGLIRTPLQKKQIKHKIECKEAKNI